MNDLLIHRFPLGRLADFPDGEIRPATLPDGKVIAIYNVSGQLYATDDRCTHGEASLSEEGSLCGNIVECPWHFGTFDVVTGKATGLPCTIALKTYPVEQEGENYHLKICPDRRGEPRLAVGAAPGRRTQEERSEATRERLMQATAQLLRTRGYGGLRTVEVSELAGVSRGAQLHHFPNKNALVIATMQYLNNAMMATSQQRAAQALQGGDPLEQVMADARDFFFGDFFFIMLAVGMSDERNEELLQGLDPMVQKGRLQVEQEWLRILEKSGLPSDLATDVLTMTLALVRGFSVRQLLIETDTKRIERLMGLWRQLISDYIRGQLSKRPGDSVPAV